MKGRGAVERDGTETLTVAIHNTRALITGNERQILVCVVSKVSIFNRLLYRERVERSPLPDF